jgi:hypothetical protein
MIGVASRIFSPSSLTLTRSTPWVAGCCGPKLISISSTSKRELSGPFIRSSPSPPLSATGPPPGG